MELFSIVDDAQAIIRQGVIYKQVKVYHRGGQLFLPHGGGYIRIMPDRFDSTFPTAHPNIKVVEIEGPGVQVEEKRLAYQNG